VDENLTDGGDPVDRQALETTRQTLHGVAELVLAGPQYDQSGTIRLRVTPRGFGTVTTPDLRVEELMVVGPAAGTPLTGTFSSLARAAGVEARPLRDVYDAGPAVGPEDPVVIDADAVHVIVDALVRGDAALRSFASDHEPVLWPEHFDLAITVAEVNYGVSPGDAHLPEPYAYVGPWEPREGAFWNAPFGATRALTELSEVESLVDFFHTGSQRADSDHPRA
jgi:hypothetical protein